MYFSSNLKEFMVLTFRKTPNSNLDAVKNTYICWGQKSGLYTSESPRLPECDLTLQNLRSLHITGQTETGSALRVF